MRASVLLALTLAFVPTVGLGETLFVNNLAGNNRNSGLNDTNQGDSAGPLRTITAALKMADRGDRIVLAKTGLPYTECISLQGTRNSGTAFTPFVIEGNGAVLDGTNEVPPELWETVREGIFRFAPARGGHQMLFLDGAPADSLPRFDVSYATSFLKPTQWCRCRGGIHFAVEKDKLPGAYDLSYAKHRVGITLYNVNNVVIRDLVVRGFRLDGVNAHDNATACALEEIESQANGRSGFSIGGASRVELIGCLARQNGETQLRAEGWSTAKLVDTKLVGKLQPIWIRQANPFGAGPRLFIDGVSQSQLRGFSLTRAEPAAPEAPPRPPADDPFADEL